jgi:CheY-like chemotaxis protein
MRKSLVVVVLSLSAVTTVATNALACGESVFRAGKGVHYRAFTAPIPGTVLVYARNDSERAVAESLREAGHDVHVVANDQELATEMQAQAFDVVVAPFSLHEAGTESAAQAASHPDVIPVLEPGSADVKVAKAEFDEVVMTNDDVRKYLKAIHHSLKERGA